jgi:hypothetical protein
MLHFGVTIPATVPQGSEIPEGLMNNSVVGEIGGTLFGEWEGKRIAIVESLQAGSVRPISNTKVETPKL